MSTVVLGAPGQIPLMFDPITILEMTESKKRMFPFSTVNALPTEFFNAPDLELSSVLTLTVTFCLMILKIARPPPGQYR